MESKTQTKTDIPACNSSSPISAQAPIMSPFGHQGHEVDPASDNDSAISGFSDVSSTTSASSSKYDSVDEADGRKYHRYRQGKYMLPNDQSEQERLNLQHHLWLMTLDYNLSLAPLTKEPEHVLDFGTGTGAWAVDYAIEHPTAAVLGTDLSPIQPEYTPINCAFEVDDIDDQWNYSQKFDLIHGRMMVPSLNDPRRTFQQAFAALSPGGFLEMQDIGMPAISDDGTLEGTALEKWYGHVIAGAKNSGGKDLGVAKIYKSLMEEVGFVDVQEKRFAWPINSWPKDPHLRKVGIWFQQDALEFVDTFKMPFMRGLGWTLEETTAFFVQVKKDLKNTNIHAYQVMRVVIGKKPETDLNDVGSF